MPDIGDFLISTFPNYTKEMYDGNAPCGKGHELLSGGFAERWTTKYGGGETSKNEIICFSFSLNKEVTIYIIGDVLNIVDNRCSGKLDEWTYCNKEGYAIHGTFLKSHQHELESERIEQYLNTKIPNCKIWEIVQKRARQLLTNRA